MVTAFVASLLIVASGLQASTEGASELTGRVVFNGVAVPGATVTATQPFDSAPIDGAQGRQGRSDHTVVTTTDDDGAFQFANLADGAWTIKVEMRGFMSESRDVTVPPSGPPLSITLTMRKYREIVSALAPVTPVNPAPGSTTPAASDAAAQDAPDILIGSSINGASTPFAQARAFGNNRPNRGAPYSGAVNTAFGSSALNARPYSFGDSAAPTPSYGDAQIGFMLAGPLKIPWLVTNGPQMNVSYQHGVLNNATTQSALMPTTAERAGDFSQVAGPVRDPLTGAAFAGNTIAANRISSQAAALLNYYPLPNATTTSGANYQKAVTTATTQDNVQFSTSKSLSNRTQLGGTFRFQRTVTDSISLFNFADASRNS